MAKSGRSRETTESPELTEEFFTKARRGVEHLPAPMRRAIDGARRRRGPQKAPTKQQVTLRLSRHVVDAYRSTGRGWQARMDSDLQRAVKRLRVSPRRTVTR
jgi:uncharacterized protein (DUF4415 family)